MNLKFIKNNIILILLVILGIFFTGFILFKNKFVKEREGYFDLTRTSSDVGTQIIISNPGPPAPAGFTGVTGPDGTIAYATIGSTGPTGPQGFGITGPTGPTGPAGLAGPAGPVGTAGTAGTAGANGPTGPTGPAAPVSSIGTAIYYPFESQDVNSSNRLADRSAGVANYNASLQSGAVISTTDKKVGTSSLNLPTGTNAYVSIDIFSPTSNGLSFICWFKTNSSGFTYLFDFGNDLQRDSIFFSPDKGPCVFQGGDRTFKSEGERDGRSGYADNAWHHFVWTLSYAPSDTSISSNNQKNSTWNIYIDNVLKYSTREGSYPNINVTRNKNYIGKSNNPNNPFMEGFVDDFRVYNRVITSQEVNALFNNS